jgi:hypothetical protein
MPEEALSQRVWTFSFSLYLHCHADVPCRLSKLTGAQIQMPQILSHAMCATFGAKVRFRVVPATI